uniref:Ig-like domain-containing protein n=1 Tax=Scophthalmus maximus TaxID=52904 RepID=A0A8D3C3E8_SCOMX
MPSCRNACSFLAEKSHHRLVVGQFFLIWLVVAQLQLGNEEILSFGSSVGGKVMFTTLLTPQEASVVVAWTFGLDNLITSKKDSNTTAQQYEGRITLFRSNGSLELRNLTVNDSGEYEVAILPPNAGIIRGSTILEIISGASVKSKTNQAVEGNFVNLTCEAAGSVFTRQWMKDGSVLIPTDNMVFHNKQRVLSFQPLKKTDSGGYSCRVANPINSDEAKYTMVVNHGPDNVQVTGPSEINLKHTLTLTCSAESTPAASYTWVLNKKEILSNSAVFTKDTTEFSDNGKYICTAVNNITGRKSSAVHGLSVTGTYMLVSDENVQIYTGYSKKLTLIYLIIFIVEN